MTPTPAQVEAIAPPWLSFMRAEEWGRTWQHPPVAEQLGDTEQFIHHTAGNEQRHLTAAEAMKAAEVFSHSKGWASVGYDIMVHGDADDQFTVCGAREGWRSAATLDRNEIGEAICAMGYYHPGHPLSALPRPRMIEALAWGIAWSIAHGWTAPDAIVYGHRDNPAHPNATGCPGDYLYPHVATIAERALAILAEALAPTPTPDPEGGPMLTIRLDGYADQFLCVPINNPDARRKMGVPDEVPPVVVQADAGQVQALLPYQLTELTP